MLSADAKTQLLLPIPHDPDARLFLHYCDLSDDTALRLAIESVKPVEVYSPAAQSHVKV